jgi:hypothetical protein
VGEWEYKVLTHREIHDGPLITSTQTAFFHSRLASPNHDASRVTLWYALRLHAAIRHSNCDIGDIEWAHKEAEQLFQGLAEVVVSATFVACILTQESDRSFPFPVAHGLPRSRGPSRESEAGGEI